MKTNRTTTGLLLIVVLACLGVMLLVIPPKIAAILSSLPQGKSKGSGLIDVSLALNTEYRGRDRRYRRPPRTDPYVKDYLIRLLR
jgi:hypothetical protein